MCCWVTGQLTFVVSPSNDVTIADDKGTNGNIAMGDGPPCLFEGQCHEFVVGHDRNLPRTCEPHEVTWNRWNEPATRGD